MSSIPGAIQPIPRNDIFDVTTMWAGENPSDGLKAGSTFIDLFKNLDFLDSDSILVPVSGGLKEGKAILAPSSFLDKANKLRHEIQGWKEGKKAIYEVGRKGLDLISPAYEFIDLLAKKILSVPGYFLNAFKGINGTVLAFSMTWNAADSAAEIGRGNDKVKNFIKITYQVAYIALGVMTGLTCFYGMVFAPLIYSVLSVVTVVFSFAEYFKDNYGKEKWALKEKTTQA